ncbi:hypothetical protein [Burkholderia multivorans]|uniref:hypothetical protein n=1 Tax=Burkholderia multivorans TaxID=87883 RepID=UPI001C27D06F|nr:hypothetical protein [Burkholderia multivorans]MBU9542849.1 hypothetical protein [Burkholderia multivorans]
MAEVKADKEEFTVEYLLKLVSSGKATATDKIRLSQMLQESAKDEAQEELKAKIEKVKKFIEDQGLTLDQVFKAIQPAPELIFEWTDEQGKTHSRFTGEKGKFPIWVETMKKSITKEKAFSYAKNDKGRTFVENVYKA